MLLTVFARLAEQILAGTAALPRPDPELLVATPARSTCAACGGPTFGRLCAKCKGEPRA